MANKTRLIDVNDALEKLCEYCSCGCYEECEYRCDEFYNISEIPTVDAVEVVHGHWYEHHGITICSYCQSMFDTDLKMLQVPSTWEMPNYCPNCGAKMDGDGNDANE